MAYEGYLELEFAKQGKNKGTSPRKSHDKKIPFIAFEYSVKAPRDVATGQSSGKRMHKPFVITKEWGPASPQLSAMKPTYDVKTMKGARVAAGADGWTSMTLSSTDGLCAATAASAAKVTKTRSNIRNN